MAIKTKEILKTYFNTGDKPTESQFADLIDSMAHVSQIGNGVSFPETDNYHFTAINNQSVDEGSIELIGITKKVGNDNPKELAVGIVKSSEEAREFALLGGYFNGLRVERTNISENGDADVAFYLTGLADVSYTNEENINFDINDDYDGVLFHNNQTGKIKRLHFDQFSMLVDIISNIRKPLKSLMSSEINNAPADSQITIDLNDNPLPPSSYIKNIIISCSGNGLNNLGVIQEAYITLPSNTQNIDVLPYIIEDGPYIIPINQPQKISSSNSTITLTLNFDAGSGEVNPQNFSFFNISIAATFSKLI